MAGCLLMAVFMYSFHEIQVQGQKPQMSVQHFKGDHVLFTCSLPGSANHETRCNLYFGEERRPVVTTTIWKKRSSTNQWFCLFTVTIDDMLRHLDLVQKSAASCDYSLGSEPNSLSPQSDGYSLTDIVKGESSMVQTKSAFTTTTDLTVSGRSASTFVTSVKPAPDTDETESRTMQNMSTFTLTTGLTVGRPQITSSFVSISQTPVKPASGQTLHKPSTKSNVFIETPLNPALETWIWRSAAVTAGFGVSVGVALLAFLCTKKQTAAECSLTSYSATENSYGLNALLEASRTLDVESVVRAHSLSPTITSPSFLYRTPANITDDDMQMRNLDHGRLLPAGNDEAYSVIISVPGADCSTGSEKLNRQEPQNEDSDIYHVYDTISEPPPSSLKDIVYNTVQAH